MPNHRTRKAGRRILRNTRGRFLVKQPRNTKGRFTHRAKRARRV